MNYEIKSYEGIEFLKRYPEGYTEGTRYPVIFFLHGAGTRGPSAESGILKNPFFKEINKYGTFPFIVIAPQCSEDTWFDMFERLKALLINTAKSPDVDPDRIYVMGASMGGYGTWQLAISLPEYVAAAVPICGGGLYWNAKRLLNVPVWAHHGELDDVVHPDESKRMVEAARRAGCDARLTLYPDVSHAAWIPVYRNPEVFEWLLSHKRHGCEVADARYNDADIYG